MASLLASGLSEEHVAFVVSDFTTQTYALAETVKKLPLFPVYNNKLGKWMGAVRQVRRHVRQERPDVVIGIMGTCSMVAKIATIGMNIPVIATEHNAFERPSSAPMSAGLRFSKFVLNKWYDHVTVLTEADKRVIGNRLKHVTVMPNPLALVPVSVVPEKEKVILAVGRLDAWHVKGFDLLFRCFQQLVHSAECREQRRAEALNKKYKINNKDDEYIDSCDWRLQIAGGGSEESLNYLKGLCRECGVEDRVDFLGFQEDIESLYKKAEIFVLSSRYEGFGLVLIEAMSQGCACVACDYKGRQREIIQDDSQGLCCEPDDVDALAQALMRMIEDEDYRKTVQKNAVERSKYYDTNKTVRRWEKLINEII